MNYCETEHAVVSQDQVRREILDHECHPEEFFIEHGLRETYKARLVLDWLGY